MLQMKLSNGACFILTVNTQMMNRLKFICTLLKSNENPRLRFIVFTKRRQTIMSAFTQFNFSASETRSRGGAMMFATLYPEEFHNNVVVPFFDSSV